MTAFKDKHGDIVIRKHSEAGGSCYSKAFKIIVVAHLRETIIDGDSSFRK